MASNCCLSIGFVAPRAGAWIETCRHDAMPPLPRSLPVRERGLKRLLGIDCIAITAVAPRAGAWIETAGRETVNRRQWSLPVRERGLKPFYTANLLLAYASLPVRERGLKHAKF